ncbi:MAG: riboflavin kinase [Acidimicrobiales bacterium]
MGGSADDGAVQGGDQQGIAGMVVRGDGRGCLLGYPTANIEIAGSVEFPPDGVYAGVLERADGSSHLGVVSVGTRPTYYGSGGVRLLEVHLIDFDADIYGEAVRLLVGGKVRDQERFDSADDLIAAMGRDVATVRRLAAAHPASTPAP